MIQEVNLEQLFYLKKILSTVFQVDYISNEYTKEYVFVKDKQIYGFIIYEYIYDRIELDYIYVNPNERKKGIASVLMEYMIQFAIRVHVKNITLEVNVNNIEAVSLYKKYNFEVCAIRKHYYDGEDGYLMIREW